MDSISTASDSHDAVTLQTRTDERKEDETVVVIGQPPPASAQPHVTFRDWYVSNYCGEADVAAITRLQDFFLGKTDRQSRFIKKYFEAWSCLSSATFYIMMAAALMWSGHVFVGVHQTVLVSVGMYATNYAKDCWLCPRPPSPPVRRGGISSHGQEYGLPSGHSTCVCIWILIVAQMIIDDRPHFRFFVIVVSLVIIAHVTLSRIVLGLHWIGDVAAGFLFFFLIWVCDVAFISSWLASLYSCYFIPMWIPFIFGQAAIVLHATPRDACPCFEDSVRFIGADVGAIAGAWLLQRRNITVPVLTFSDVLTLSFIYRYLLGLTLVVAARAVSILFVPRLLRSALPYFAGSGCPAQCPPKHRTALAFVAGIFLGKTMTCIPLPDGNLQAKPRPCGEGHSGFDVFEFSTSLGGNAEEQRGGLFWTLRNHTHWWEADIVSKYVTYTVVGLVTAFVVPALLFRG